MTNDDLILIRNKQNEFNAKIKKLEEYKKRILELEQNPIMKEYYELKKFVENNSEEAIKKQNKKQIDVILCYTTDSNKVLYDYGEISVVTYEGYYNDEDEYSVMHVYRDLETAEYYIEMIDTIALMPPEWRVGYTTEHNEYECLRKCFIEEIQNKSQEKVISLLLEKNKKLVRERNI